MTRFLIFLLALFWAGVALVALAPRFFEADFLAQDIERRLSHATGHQVSVSNDVAFQILPSPAFQVTELKILRNDSSVGDIASGSGELMTAEAVTLHVHPWALLFGQFQAARIEVIAPKVRLTRDAQGVTAWENAPIFAALTAPSALVRSQDNRFAGERGLSSEIEFVAASVYVQDVKTGFEERLIIPRLAIVPDSQGRAMSVSFDFDRRGWKLQGKGHVGLLPDNGDVGIGVSGRGFTLSMGGRNSGTGEQFETLTLVGELSDAVLDRLEVRESDGWRVSLTGYESPALQSTVGKILDFSQVQFGLSSDRLRFYEDGLALSALELKLLDKGKEDENALVAMGGLERLVSEGQSSISTSLTLAEQSISDGAMERLLVSGKQVFDQALELVPAQQLSGALTFTNVNDLSGSTAFTLEQDALTLSEFSMVNGEKFAGEFPTIEVPLGNNPVVVSGSFAALTSRNNWLALALPDLWALSPNSESIEFTGRVAFSDWGQPASAIESSMLRYDESVEFEYLRQQDKVQVSAPSLDLRWLTAGPVMTDLGGAEQANGTLVSLLDQSAALVDLRETIGTNVLEIRADEAALGRLRLGKTTMALEADEGQRTTAKIEAEGADRLEGDLTFIHQDDGALQLTQLNAVVAGSSLLAEKVGYPDGWAEFSYLSLDSRDDLIIGFDRELGQQWTFEQDNHLVTVSSKRDLISWQKSPISLSTLIADRAGSRAPLLSDLAVAGQGTAQLSAPERQASTLLANQGGEVVSLTVENVKDTLKVSSLGLNPLSVMPNLDGFELSWDEQLSASGEGWNLTGTMGQDAASLTLVAETLSLPSLLDAVSTIEFTDTLLSQGVINLEVQLAALEDGSQTSVAQNVRMRGRFSGGRLTVSELSASLVGGHELRATGQADLLAGIFGRFEFDLTTSQRHLAFGPYALSLKPGNIRGQLSIAGADSAEIIDGMNITLSLSQLPLGLSSRYPNIQGWAELLASGEGQLLRALFEEGKAFDYSVTGNLNYRGGQWRTSGLDLSPADAGAPSLFVEGSFFANSQALDGSVRAIVPNDDGLEPLQAILATSSSIVSPNLRLLGTYFRE